MCWCSFLNYLFRFTKINATTAVFRWAESRHSVTRSCVFARIRSHRSETTGQHFHHQAVLIFLCPEGEASASKPVITFQQQHRFRQPVSDKMKSAIAGLCFSASAAALHVGSRGVPCHDHPFSDDAAWRKHTVNVLSNNLLVDCINNSPQVNFLSTANPDPNTCADPNFYRDPSNGWYALHWACYHGRSDVVEE